MNKKVVILGTAHGVNVAGKRSPDGAFREYRYSRDICRLVKKKLEAIGYMVVVDWPNDEVPAQQTDELMLRANIVNDICQAYGKGNCVYVSIHCNAAGNGKEWMSARGWSVYTTIGQTKSDELATCLWDAAKEILPQTHKSAVRADRTDGDPDMEQNFYVLRATNCPAVLTENLFQDNKEDVAYLETFEGRDAIAKLHAVGIDKFLRNS